MILGVGGCTQADGYIGHWFGSWHLEEMLIDGEEDPSYRKNLMISFQGKIFKFGYLDSVEIFGSWEYEGEILTLNAGYGAGNGAGNSTFFDPFPIPMHFPKGEEQVEVSVTYINSNTMQWQYTDQYGQFITYNFRKYP